MSVDSGKVELVAFDFGGVLTPSPWVALEGYAVELGLAPRTFVRFIEADPKMDEWFTGVITGREFFKYVCVQVQADNDVRVDIRRLSDAADVGVAHPEPVMLELVARVKRERRTALVTNNVTGARWRDTFPFDLFDIVLDSSVLGVRKPDPRMYQELVRSAGVAPAGIVFIDDFEQNLGPAEALGIRTIRFENPKQCEADLIAMGGLDDGAQRASPSSSRPARPSFS
jgi:epoxide hydrolase-like predicted phosphatase